jgi:hypothetical protein
MTGLSRTKSWSAALWPSGLLSGFLLTGFDLSCESQLTANECDQLLDRYVEKLVQEEHPETSTEELARRKELARELAHADPRYEFERCPVVVRATHFRCAMQANTVDGMERCLVM